jgi:hypothetical protein
MHYSPYGAYHSTTSEDTLATWGPIFDQKNVNVVLSGHDHIYSRTPKMSGGEVSPTESYGTVYISGGSASEKIYTASPPYSTPYSFILTESKNVITIVSIENGQLVFTTIDVNGTIVDTYTLLQVIL